MPTTMSIGSEVNPLNLNWTTRGRRGLQGIMRAHRQIFSASPTIRKVWTSLSWLMLSKNPWISNCKEPQQPPHRMGCSNVACECEACVRNCRGVWVGDEEVGMDQVEGTDGPMLSCRIPDPLCYDFFQSLTAACVGQTRCSTNNDSHHNRIASQPTFHSEFQIHKWISPT